MSRHDALVILILALVSFGHSVRAAPCTSANSSKRVGEIVREERGVVSVRITSAIITGELTVVRADVEDDEEFPVYLSLETDNGPEGLTHYRAGSVSHFVQCLLEARYGLETDSLLASLRPDLSHLLPTPNCGVCCSGDSPLHDAIEVVLKEYWTNFLASKEERPPSK